MISSDWHARNEQICRELERQRLIEPEEDGGCPSGVCPLENSWLDPLDIDVDELEDPFDVF